MPSEQLVLCEVFSLPISLPLPVQLFHGWPISCCSCPGSMCSLLAGSRNWNLNQLENQLVTNFWPFFQFLHMSCLPPHLFQWVTSHSLWRGFNNWFTDWCSVLPAKHATIICCFVQLQPTLHLNLLCCLLGTIQNVWTIFQQGIFLILFTSWYLLLFIGKGEVYTGF